MRTDDGRADVNVTGPDMKAAMDAAAAVLRARGWRVDQLVLVADGARQEQPERAVASIPEGQLGEALTLMGEAMGVWLSAGGITVEQRMVAAEALARGLV